MCYFFFPFRLDVALNTLDLLKKGTSPLAQRARAASRMLEQQVGANPRIKVQRDEAYVLWDSIPFVKNSETTNIAGGDPTNLATDDIINTNNTNSTNNTNTNNNNNKQKLVNAAPEWVRRTICCARWEFDQFLSPTASTHQNGDGSVAPAQEKGNDHAHASQQNEQSASTPHVIVAVCLEMAQLPDATHAVNSPVPLPAPHQASKHEQRCTGALVAQWARAAGVPVAEFKATPLPAPTGARRGAPHARALSDEEPTFSPGSSPHRPKSATIRMKSGGAFGGGGGGSGDKPLQVFGPGRSGGALVERPAATMAMNDVVQLSKPIRLLARGEKLDP